MTDAGQYREQLAKLYFDHGVYGGEPGDMPSSTWRQARRLANIIARKVGSTPDSVLVQAYEDATAMADEQDPTQKARDELAGQIQSSIEESFKHLTPEQVTDVLQGMLEWLAEDVR